MIGQKLNNRYKITSRLGKGAMGTVYRATNTQTGQEVALKVISSEQAIEPEMLERFKREGESLRQLKHPNIVGFIDSFQHDEQYVIVMELVPGGSLHDLIKQGPLPVEQARQIALDLCDALIRAHRLNIIHRDIKPENVLIDQDQTPKLADFGVARLSEGTRMTRSGTQVGTPYYMAPEAWEGKNLDAQADIWSLGILLFEMLTGQVPFGGDTGAAVMNKVLTSQPLDLKKIRADVPPGLVKIIKRMLTREKNRRYQTMREVAVDLERDQQSITLVLAEKKESARPRWLLWGSIGLVGALSIAGIARIVSPVIRQTPGILSNTILSIASAMNAGQVAATGQNSAACPTETDENGKVEVRWIIGFQAGAGNDPAQLTTEQAVVDDFNKSQDKILLTTEVVPSASAVDTILAEIASGNSPDIIGAAGWRRANSLHGHWLNLQDCIAGIPQITKDFDPALLASYDNSEGQIGLPFAEFPSAIFYNTKLFDKAGLAYPPAKYNESYKLDGKDVVWNWETLKTVAQRLTLDANGRNATESGFDKSQIVQYGFSWNWENPPSYIGAFMSSGGSYTATDGKTAQLPDGWKAAWEWTYNGIWEDQPFIPNASVSASPDFGRDGNVFNSGKIAMIDQPSWYMCCIGHLQTWDLGAMPSNQGIVNGRIDADTFRILKSSKHPGAAFEVLTYLTTTGVEKLMIGNDALPAVYGLAVPARMQDHAAWLAAKKSQFPWVKNWDVILAGLSYPDSPSAESYMPNFDEAWSRGDTFYSLLTGTGGLDLNKEEVAFLHDLQDIFNR